MYNYFNFNSITFNLFTFSELFALIISLVLLFISGLISASEIAFFSIGPKLMTEVEERDTKNGSKILRLTESPQRLLATILIGKNFVNVTVILILTFVINRLINFQDAPVTGVVLQIITLTFLLLLIGEITPKIYASKNRLKVAVFTAPFLLFLHSFFSPVINLMLKSSSTINKRLEKHNKTNISIDELSHALELTSDKSDEETEILEGIIKFGNINVVDIMTSRLDIVDVDIKTPYKTLLKKIIDCGYSRIPVFSESRDNIKGFLYGKDLLPHLDKPAGFRWQSLIRPPFYVPETKKIDDLLNEFQQNKIHLAIVVDEYGGTSGLVTLEDIIEEIVGDISDEYDDDEKLFTKLDNHTFIFEAKILLNDFFKIDEIDENSFTGIIDEVETLAGLILELKGEIPAKNDQIEHNGYIFEIMAVDNRRIKKVKLHIKEKHE